MPHDARRVATGMLGRASAAMGWPADSAGLARGCGIIRSHNGSAAEQGRRNNERLFRGAVGRVGGEGAIQPHTGHLLRGCMPLPVLYVRPQMKGWSARCPKQRIFTSGCRLPPPPCFTGVFIAPRQPDVFRSPQNLLKTSITCFQSTSNYEINCFQNV